MEYRTPGVYVEEISKLPPAVAQVESAIPVFIGITEKAKAEEADDLLFVAKRITSALEYEEYFGGAQKETINVLVEELSDGSRRVVAEEPVPTTLMRYGIQMYFANGGGPCYILSIGLYTSNFDPAINPDNGAVARLNRGLSVLEEEDEPTLIVFPDLVNIDDADILYSTYAAALSHCHKMQDRFTLIDTLEGEKWDDVVLRDKLSSEYLNYGAAYFPHVKTALNFTYLEEDVTLPDPVAPLAQAIGDISVEIGDAVDSLTRLPSDYLGEYTVAQAKALGTPVGQEEEGGNEASNALGKIISQFQNVFTAGKRAEVLGEEVRTYFDELNARNPDVNIYVTPIEGAVSDIGGAINTFDGQKSNLEDRKRDLDATLQPYVEADMIVQITTINGLVLDIPNVSPLIAQIRAVQDRVDALQGVIAGITVPVVTLASIKGYDDELYHETKAAIQKLRVTIPPSSLIAGVIARTDNDRGFWKAPANVTLANVVGPVSKVTNDIQDRMNVDPTAGKSVNAIRFFTGKGTLVWGARTLEGNSREWRYVNVRRSFIVIEESIKKAVEAFVFEANDRNTWSKVRSMITSYLTGLWRQGALLGDKPEESFRVAIGLNETMTPTDVLDGKMIVRIELALVRPAEFIILRFEHMMADA